MAYSKFERHTWHDERFRGWKRDVRDMWKYILTSPHTNRLGCFVLDPMYAAADLSAADDRWSEARAEAAIRELEQTGRIRYDWSTRLLLIVRHFKHNHPENPNVATAAAREVDPLPYSETLLKGLLEGCLKYTKQRTDKGEAFCDVIVNAIKAKLRNSPPPNNLNGSGNGSGNVPPTLPKQEHEPLPEPEHKEATATTGAGASAKTNAPGEYPPPSAPPSADREELASEIIHAVNEAQRANPAIDQRRLKPILTSHASRQDALDWLALEIPAELILEVVTTRAAAFRPGGRNTQIRSLNYFNDAVREEFENRKQHGRTNGKPAGRRPAGEVAGEESRREGDYAAISE